MAFEDEILQLEKLIKAGVSRVSYDDGKSSELVSFKDLLARLRWMQNQQAGESSGGSSFVTFNRDE